MTLHDYNPASHVPAYYLNNSLLFQFILSEFFDAYEEIQSLDMLCFRNAATLPINQVFNNEEFREKIEVILTKLVGSTREYMRLFSWSFGDGLLQKLKIYSSLFLKNTESGEKEMIALQHYTDKVWQISLHALDVLREDPDERIAFLSTTEKASATMHRLAKLIVRIIYQFRDDENVIFFILRRKKQVDKLYGPRFVLKLLNRLYPKGPREAQLFLTKRYSDRGFSNIINTISNKIAELEISSA